MTFGLLPYMRLRHIICSVSLPRVGSRLREAQTAGGVSCLFSTRPAVQFVWLAQWFLTSPRCAHLAASVERLSRSFQVVPLAALSFDEDLMRVLVACEFSGVVRDAFIRGGHEAMSCDLLPTEAPGPHYQGDVRDLLDFPFDLMIAHPPCTHLSVSGARHFDAKKMDGRQQSAASFFLMLSKADIPRICIENPVCILSSLWRKPDQTIQPWQFGHGETKATCLWLRGLPPLKPTNVVDGREARVHHMPPSEERWKERSRTYQGIADAMASQWGM